MQPNNRFPLLMGISLLLTILLTITGCNKSDEPKSESEAPVQNDVDVLSQFMTIPTQPREVQWVRFRSDSNPLLTDPNYRVMAVLRYDEESIARIQNEVLYLVRNNMTIQPNTASAWFPETLKQELQEIEGETITTYHPKPFYKSPYSQGSLYVVGGVCGGGITNRNLVIWWITKKMSTVVENCARLFDFRCRYHYAGTNTVTSFNSSSRA